MHESGEGKVKVRSDKRGEVEIGALADEMFRGVKGSKPRISVFNPKQEVVGGIMRGEEEPKVIEKVEEGEEKEGEEVKERELEKVEDIEGVVEVAAAEVEEGVADIGPSESEETLVETPEIAVEEIIEGIKEAETKVEENLAEETEEEVAGVLKSRPIAQTPSRLLLLSLVHFHLLSVPLT